MGQNIQQVMTRLFELYEKGKFLEKEWDEYLKDPKPGKKQSLNLRNKQLDSQVKSLSERFRKLVIGEIIRVDYLIDGEEAHGTFVNLSDDDIKQIYNLFSLVENVKIEIIRIERRPTKIKS